MDKDFYLKEFRDFLANKPFQSGPLISYEERHGGPVWFNVAIISMHFIRNNKVEFRIDTSLSKRMSPGAIELETYGGRFNLIVAKPGYFTGEIILDTAEKFHFEALYDKTDHLFLEKPPFWKESVVVKLME